MSERESDRRPAGDLDLRLALPAAAAWLTTAVTLLTGARWGAAIAAGSLLILSVAAIVSRRRGAPASPLVRTVVVVVGIGGAFATVAVARVLEVDSHPVRQAAERGQYATIEATITDDPRLLTGSRPSVLVRLSGSRALIAGTEVASEFSAIAFTPVDGWLGLVPGQQVIVRARLALPDRNDLTAAQLIVTGAPIEVRAPPLHQQWASGLRAGLVAVADETLPEDPAGLLPALVVGDISGLDEDLVADFAAAGLTHLTAVSGANFTLVVGSALALARALTIGPRTATAIAALVLIAFVVICRPSPSVLRAAVMSAVGLLALVASRRKQAMPALAVAVIGLLAWQPALAVAPGFALSVLATAALIVVAPVLVAVLHRPPIPKVVVEAVAVAVAAHLATMPVLVALGSPVGPIAMLANLLVAPVIPPITVLGAIAAVVAPISAAVAEVPARAAGPPLWWLIEVARWAAVRA